MRAAVLSHIDIVEPGSDILLVARKQLLNAKYEDIRSAVKTLLFKARLLKDRVDD